MIPKTFDLFRRKFKPLLLNRPFVSNQVTFLWNAFCSPLICQMECRHTAVIFEYEFYSSTLLVHQAAASPTSMHSYWSVHIENIEHQISNVTSFLGNCFCQSSIQESICTKHIIPPPTNEYTFVCYYSIPPRRSNSPKLNWLYCFQSSSCRSSQSSLHSIERETHTKVYLSAILHVNGPPLKLFRRYIDGWLDIFSAASG